MKKVKKCLMVTLMFLSVNAYCQISILNSNLNSLNVSPESICQVNIMNGSGSETQVIIEAKLLNSANEEILVAKTNPLLLSIGLNNGINLNYSLQVSRYGFTGQAQYVSTTHTLPSGNFKYCVSVVVVGGEGGDDYCEDVISDVSSFLSLVFPYDKDTIETMNPLLTWTHSEPFNILSTGDHFRMIVVELASEQSAEAGVIANNPVFYKNFLSTHQEQYPYDAKELKEGTRYGWQVQKISNGTIIEKTEAWEFTIYKPIVNPDIKYATLKKKNDGTYYTAVNDKIYFRFFESYNNQELDIRIYDSKRHEMKPEVSNDKNALDNDSNLKMSGANYYLLDLSSYRLKEGNYSLEVYNAKKEKYLLSFKVE